MILFSKQLCQKKNLEDELIAALVQQMNFNLQSGFSLKPSGQTKKV